MKDKFLKKYKLPKIIQEERNEHNIPISTK